jgi:hypothetical protein
MKRKLGLISLACTLMLMTLFGPSRTVQGTGDWSSQMYECSNTYWHAVAYECPSNQDPLGCRNGALNTYASCQGGINTHMEQPDFCDNARLARNSCNAVFCCVENPDYDAWAICTDNSGIWMCE